MENDESLVIIRELVSEFNRLCQRVITSCRLDANDPTGLDVMRGEVMNFRESIDRFSYLLSEEESRSLQGDITDMIHRLDLAANQELDPLPRQYPKPARKVYTGHSGRPRYHIDSQFLAEAQRMKKKNTYIGERIGVSARTVRRNKLRQQLEEPSPLIYVAERNADGHVISRHNLPRPRRAGRLSDPELDELVRLWRSGIVFRDNGRQMLDGWLVSLGHRVSLRRIARALHRTSTVRRRFERRVIERRPHYRVAGPNSLWHHDGQHGLIRWKIIIHAFVDGYSRSVVSIRASNNNRADTVEHVFHAGRAEFGDPSRVRGDHGGENVRVAKWMVDFRGRSRGSYIWGLSVHNVRIERMWVDVTTDFGGPWAKFFHELELLEGLDVENNAHIWLLHHLFLDMINADARAWQNTWNYHTLSIRGERNAQPADLFMFGAVEHGLRGIDIAEEDQADQEYEPNSGYGVDWAALDNNDVRDHLRTNNSTENVEGVALDMYSDDQPEPLHTVLVDEPRCPFAAEEVRELDDQLEGKFIGRSEAQMHQRWRLALHVCQEMFS